MEPSIKDKHIILGFIGVAICLISFFLTLVVAESFNQDHFVQLIVFVCSNLLGWLLYFSFQAFIFDSYQIYKIKFGKEETKETPAEIVTVQEAEPQDKIAPVAPTTEEASPDIKPMELAIDPKLHEANRASYKDRQEQEKEERVRMVMEYIHFIMPRIADGETVTQRFPFSRSVISYGTYRSVSCIRNTIRERTAPVSSAPFSHGNLPVRI